MRIRIHSEGRKIGLSLPTGLVFNRGTLWLVNCVGRKYAGDALQNLSPEALDKLFTEIRRIKKQHGKWNLVEVESASGEQVLIQL